MRRHLRARHVVPVALALVVLVVVGIVSAQWLASRPHFDGPRARVPVVALAPLLAAILVSATLAGADPELEASTPRLSTRWRAAHGVLATTLAAFLVSLCAVPDPATYGSLALLRNGLGLVGLVLLSAVVLPVGLCWVPALGYTLAVYIAAPHPVTPVAAWWAWPMPPGDLDGSWVVALALLVVGVGGYAINGPAGSARDD